MVATKKIETPFLQGATWKRQRVMGTSYSWGDSNWAEKKNFAQWKQSAIGIISLGRWWIPQHWTLLEFTGHSAGPSCSGCAFAKKGWIR